jgi:hypothetical protein
MTLPISLVVGADILLAPPLLGTDPFGRGLIVGSSPNARTAPNELYAIYRSIEAVKTDYGVEAPEYRIAKRYFAQIPRPKSLMIATVTPTNSAASIVLYSEDSGSLDDLQPAIGDTLTITVNGVTTQSAAFNDGSAQSWVLQALIGAGLNASTSTSGDVTYNWQINAPLTGSQVVTIVPTSSDRVIFRANLDGGGDLGGMPLGPDVNQLDPVTFTLGQSGGTALGSLEQIWDATQSFYGVCFTDEVASDQMQDVVDWCQSHYRMPFFVMTDSAEAISTVTDINQLGYYTHITTYHDEHDEVGAIMGMALDQKFDQPNGIKTLKFKTLVGTVPTTIGETLAGQLDAAEVNYYSEYGNPDQPIVMYAQGYAGAGKFADFVMGLHWLRNDAQTEVFNTFRINPKVSQTESGMSILKAAVARSCMRGVDNGLIAEGQWNGQPLGAVNTGDWLQTGYYIYAEKIRNQSQQVRETRQAQPISVLVKGAGALHGADIAFIGEQ